ncbi:MaoC/PaaZ C-terminal domain-containing protein [Novosphingobium album (ex Liu et al. 2023)]|uniref:MaoC/PaaZ C-terminal domain-containing protein n=1 Tax=Novosphingobium album (ex Liu et al. 2023) TaxID=3031130 RepID=A0ABT5WXR2_9SPHN|nr:MaoC/PaaZ C-terminal domain-containing protein [Novosphingobium album (ex Liu et al. 2023)]MDE8654518.1 MaoC/PaaZ C-terminal domain-containing protein [Novosphingobium album (ex Liu et al. 2023)]
MGFAPDRVRAARIETRQAYDWRDTILYALGVGVGMGESATDPEALRHVYEERLEALPAMATTLAYPSLWLADPVYGLDWRRIVNGAQALAVHRPLPVAATIASVLTVEGIVDKGLDDSGAGRGALVHAVRHLHDAASGDHLATVRQVFFCRGEGGFGGDDLAPIAARPVPGRAPDRLVTIPTRREAALIFRLSGDLNPLHIDPQVAAAAGFRRPVLHGLATFGRAAYAVGGGALTRLEARYSAPVLPGETLRCAIWDQGDERAFQVINLDSGRIALDNGWAAWRERLETRG